jgi:hypothetical protein
MNRTDIPLRAVFGLEGPTAEDSAVTPEMTRTALAAVRKALEHASAAGFILRTLDVGPSVLAELARALATPLSEVVGNAWNKRQEIRAYADTTKYPPDESHAVWLYEHELSETVKPKVEIRYAGARIATVEFQAVATLKFHSLILIIRGGRIIAVQLGGVSVAASLSVLGQDLIARESREWDFTGSVPLGEGIKIPA